jgi:hypothetical protein
MKKKQKQKIASQKAWLWNDDEKQGRVLSTIHVRADGVVKHLVIRG